MLKGQKLFFCSEAPGLVFQQLICEGNLPPPLFPSASLGARASPTDKLRKDSVLTPVTTEKPLSLELPSEERILREGLVEITKRDLES
jgi:hypothetical protein